MTNHTSNYDRAFTEAIQNKLFVRLSDGTVAVSQKCRDKISDYEQGKFKNKFFGYKKSWLHKQLYKWQEKLSTKTYNFQWSLKNLESFCTLANIDPNRILLTEKDESTAFLSKEAVISICKTISNNKTLLKDELILPIEYSPVSMTFFFFKIYTKLDDVMVTFHVSYFDPVSCEVFTDEYGNCVNISSPKKNRNFTLEEVYETVKQTYQDFLLTYPDYIKEKSTINNLKQIIQEVKDELFYDLYYSELSIPKVANPSPLDNLASSSYENTTHQER